MLLTVQVFYPLMYELQFFSEMEMDPEDALKRFTIVIVVATEISLITPLVCINVVVPKSMLKEVPISPVFRGILPFWIAGIVGLKLIVPVLGLSAWRLVAMECRRPINLSISKKEDFS